MELIIIGILAFAFYQWHRDKVDTQKKKEEYYKVNNTYKGFTDLPEQIEKRNMESRARKDAIGRAVSHGFNTGFIQKTISEILKNF